MPHALLKSSGQVVSILTGCARCTFGDDLLQAASEFKQHSISLLPVNETVCMVLGCKQSTRGCFHALIVGISYGGAASMSSACLTSLTFILTQLI
jgi:hypothetical protein